jgi:hypothetical protein
MLKSKRLFTGFVAVELQIQGELIEHIVKMGGAGNGS